jgi:hypothetical protein
LKSFLLSAECHPSFSGFAFHIVRSREKARQKPRGVMSRQNETDDFASSSNDAMVLQLLNDRI